MRCGSPVDGVDDGDAALDAVALGVVEADGELVGGRVEVVLGDALGEGHLDEARLEVHRDCGAVADRAAEVVDVDVVAEDVTGVACRRTRSGCR